MGWEMMVRINKILCIVLHEAHRWQVEETINTLSEIGGILQNLLLNSSIGITLETGLIMSLL
jgi:hypothetical protein